MTPNKNTNEQNKKEDKELKNKLQDLSSDISAHREEMIEVARQIGLYCLKEKFLKNYPESYIKLFEKISNFFKDYYIETKETGQKHYSFYKVFVKKEEYIIPAAALIEFFKTKKNIKEKIENILTNFLSPKIRQDLSFLESEEKTIEQIISTHIKHIIERAIDKELYDFIIFVFTLSAKDDVLDKIIEGRIKEIENSFPEDIKKINIQEIDDKKQLDLLEEYYIYKYIKQRYKKDQKTFIKVLNLFFRRIIFYIFYYDIFSKFTRSSEDLLKCVGEEIFSYLKSGRFDFLGNLKDYELPPEIIFKFIFNNIVNHILNIFPLKKKRKRSIKNI